MRFSVVAGISVFALIVANGYLFHSKKTIDTIKTQITQPNITRKLSLQKIAVKKRNSSQMANTEPSTTNDDTNWFKRTPVGEWIPYKNVYLLRLPDEFPELTDKEKKLIKEKWNNQLHQFFVSEFGAIDDRFSQYEHARIESFFDYDKIIEPLEQEVNLKFGSKAQIALTDDLRKIYDEAWEIFDHRVKSVVGSDRFQRLEKLRDDYSTWVYKTYHVGWNDGR
ncbi:MAG: hypothetical protein AB7F43_12595 [Bacteriovoracia bacterium]